MEFDDSPFFANYLDALDDVKDIRKQFLIPHDIMERMRSIYAATLWGFSQKIQSNTSINN